MNLLWVGAGRWQGAACDKTRRPRVSYSPGLHAGGRGLGHVSLVVIQPENKTKRPELIQMTQLMQVVDSIDAGQTHLHSKYVRITDIGDREVDECADLPRQATAFEVDGADWRRNAGKADWQGHEPPGGQVVADGEPW